MNRHLVVEILARYVEARSHIDDMWMIRRDSYVCRGCMWMIRRDSYVYFLEYMYNQLILCDQYRATHTVDRIRIL